MGDNSDIKQELEKLELRLLHSDVRKNPELLNELRSDDFEEIGSIGTVSSRDDVIKWLVTKEKNVQWALQDFRVRELTPDIVIAIYRAHKKDQIQNSSNGSIRCSIWKKYNGYWKMTFHQGTKIL